jgi:hypothetical protein
MRSSVPSFWSVRRFRHHSPAVTQRDGEAPQLRSSPSSVIDPRWPQSTCACLPGGVSNRRTATDVRGFPLRPQPVRQNRVATGKLRSRSSRNNTCAFHTPACSRSFRYALNGSSLLSGAGLGP